MWWLPGLRAAAPSKVRTRRPLDTPCRTPTPPVTATELDRFTAAIANNLDVAELDEHRFEMLVAGGYGDASILVFQATDGMDPATTAQLN